MNPHIDQARDEVLTPAVDKLSLRRNGRVPRRPDRRNVPVPDDNGAVLKAASIVHRNYADMHEGGDGSRARRCPVQKAYWVCDILAYGRRTLGSSRTHLQQQAANQQKSRDAPQHTGATASLVRG